MSDDFERQLESLTRELHRPNPAAAWKDELLTRAQAGTHRRSSRWLAIPLAASWVAILAFRLSAPVIPLMNEIQCSPLPLSPTLYAFRNLPSNLELP